MVERSAEQILQWSHWRRWHQAWARYYHYQRRNGQAQLAHRATEVQPKPTTLEIVWQRLSAVLPPNKRPGRPYGHDRRRVLEAIVYLMQTGCAWRALPTTFPPWQTVYAQLVQWRTSGIWATIWAGLEQPDTTNQLQL